jgi:hypothetical protein
MEWEQSTKSHFEPNIGTESIERDWMEVGKLGYSGGAHSDAIGARMKISWALYSALIGDCKMVLKWLKSAIVRKYWEWSKKSVSQQPEAGEW